MYERLPFDKSEIITKLGDTTQASEQAAAHKDPFSISRKAKDLTGVHKML